mmetsp:Transcript_47836/g.89057  ORF Transcript_47836/g.89057 Transcript_47836/m.89057 type:complete len:258 (-) Transcript_47836:1699-2472(-)
MLYGVRLRLEPVHDRSCGDACAAPVSRRGRRAPPSWLISLPVPLLPVHLAIPILSLLPLLSLLLVLVLVAVILRRRMSPGRGCGPTKEPRRGGPPSLDRAPVACQHQRLQGQHEGGVDHRPGSGGPGREGAGVYTQADAVQHERAPRRAARQRRGCQATPEQGAGAPGGEGGASGSRSRPQLHGPNCRSWRGCCKPGREAARAPRRAAPRECARVATAGLLRPARLCADQHEVPPRVRRRLCDLRVRRGGVRGAQVL